MMFRGAYVPLLLVAACAGGELTPPDAAPGGEGSSQQVDAAVVVLVDGTPCSGFQYEDHCYTLHETTTNITWAAAKTKCEQERPGGHLVTFENALEADYVTGGLKPQRRGWIGFEDRAVEGTFVWVTGEPAVYTNWKTGEPNNGLTGGNEDCGTYAGPADLWQWIDVDCGGGTNFVYSYICELE